MSGVRGGRPGPVGYVARVRRRLPVLVLAAGLCLTGCSTTVTGQAAPAPEPPAPAAPGEPAPVSEFCAAVEDTVEPGNRLAGYSAGQPATDAEIDETIAELRPAIDRVRTTAPPEVADEVATTADVTNTVLDSLAASHDPQAVSSDPGVVFAVLGAGGSPQRVREFANADCGIDLVFLPNS